ncbi:MAG TPA: AAA family ATPase [Sphingobium sp.]|uniref:AAA family ATPase n=1 Tax=Sphingobium sp. TaxID=1912891 RepID=UPI002ED02C6C
MDATPTRAVRLTHMHLRNWKSFERADLAIPQTDAQHSTVIIGGPNGFGKSSILEAFAFGLFGRRAISDIGFLMNGTGGRSEIRRTYKTLLEKSLHRSERALDDGTCSVGLEFATDDGPIIIERRWYFDETGAFLEEDEEIFVRTGEDRDLLPTPNGVSPREWYQEEIERRLMPAALAPFFIFDGEQVERWADRKLTEQVRMAVSRMLGLHDLAGLADDLKDYARDRERGVADEPGALSLERLHDQVEELEQSVAEQEQALTACNDLLSDLRATRDGTLAQLAALSAGSHADLQQIIEEEHRLVLEEKRLEREMAGALADHGPILLAGTTLIRAVQEKLEARDASGGHVLERSDVDVLWNRFATLAPRLDKALTSELHQRFLDTLLPAEANEAIDDGHSHLDRSDARVIVEMLQQAQPRARDVVKRLRGEVIAIRESLSRLRTTALDQEKRATEIQAAQGLLAETTQKIEDHELSRGSIRQRLSSFSDTLRPMRKERDHRIEQMREAEPRLRSAASARALAGQLEAHMSRLADVEHERFAGAVTQSYRRLAHKNQIGRIAIGADGTISLFDTAGRDITDYRLSAGESQLFAMALIAAVGVIVGDQLPLIVDTPLGRLDTDHRSAVLNMLGKRSAQTILLMQPEEITAHHMDQLTDVIAGHAQLEHAIDPLSGVGVTKIRTGMPRHPMSA